MPNNEVPYKPEQAQLAVANESSQGSAAAAGYRLFGYVQEATSLPDPNINWIEERIIGGTREIFNKVEGQNAYEGGSIPVTPYDGAPIAFMLGDDTVSGNTHVITALTNDIPPTQTIEAFYAASTSSSADNFLRQFTGCAVQSGEISINNEEELAVSLEYIAMGVSTDTTQTEDPDVPTRSPWLFHNVTSNLKLFGTSFARVNDFSLSVTNNLQDGRYLEDTQAPDPFEILYGMTEYELSANITVDDNTIYQELIGERELSGGGTSDKAPFAADIEFTKPDSGDKLTIACKDCNIESAPHDIPAEEQTVDVDVSIIPESVTVTVEDNTFPADTSYLE